MEGVEKRKRFQGIGKFWKYCKSHMWVSFATAILVCVLLLLIIIFVYMRKQYYDYLVETTFTTEDVLLEAVSINLENQMEDFIDIGANISIDTDFNQRIFESLQIEEEAQKNRNMKAALQAAARTSAYIAGVALADEEGILYQFVKNETNNSGEIWQEENEEQIQAAFENLRDINMQNSVPRYIIITEPNKHPNISNRGILHIAFPIKNEGQNFYRDMQYIVLISFYNDSLRDFLSQLNENREEYIQGYIEDEDGSILLNTGEGMYRDENFADYLDEKELIDLSKNVEGLDWILHVVINEQIMSEALDSMYMQMLVLFFLVVLLVMFLLFWTANKLLNPIKIISNSIVKVKDGNIREQIPVRGTNEVWQLVCEYNEMLAVIRKANQELLNQHEQVIESMKMQQRAEREALESQINAHFICNTLNAINYEALDRGDYQVSVLLKKLSNILRYTFDQKHQNVYMFQEIAWIDQYLYLQKERLGNVFEYSIEFDSDYDNWPSRKLMLQPFVENSILHGFEGWETGGVIRIKGCGYKEFLKILIEDNGMGMNREHAKTVRDILDNPMLAKKYKMGIGISNVITRMRMYYGREFQVSMDTEEGKGTKFTFIFPIPEE